MKFESARWNIRLERCPELRKGFGVCEAQLGGGIHAWVYPVELVVRRVRTASTTTQDREEERG